MAKILLLDDEDLLRRMIAQTLVDEGHEVFDYANGKVMRDAEFVAGFDLLITDIIMPEVDGLEAVIAAKRANPAIKIIAVSGGGKSLTLDYLPYAKSFGALAVLHKPFGIRELLGEVRDALDEPVLMLKSA